MHGDKEVSTKELARHTGAKRIVPCTAERAQKLTGYKFGGTSPFGTLKKMQVMLKKLYFNLIKSISTVEVVDSLSRSSNGFAQGFRCR